MIERVFVGGGGRHRRRHRRRRRRPVSSACRRGWARRTSGISTASRDFLLAPAENDDGAAASSASGVAATTSSPPAPCVFVAGVRVWDRRARRCRGVASSTAAMEAERGVGFVVVVVVVVAWRSRGTATGAGIGAVGRRGDARDERVPLRSKRDVARGDPRVERAFVSLAVRAARSAWSLVNVASMTRSSPEGDERVRVAPGAPRGGDDARAVSSSSDGRGQCAGHGARPRPSWACRARGQWRGWHTSSSNWADALGANRNRTEFSRKTKRRPDLSHTPSRAHDRSRARVTTRRVRKDGKKIIIVCSPSGLREGTHSSLRSSRAP